MAKRRLKSVASERAAPPDARPGAALRAIRRQRGWTLAEVSRRADVPISTLSKIENDRNAPSYDKLARISAGLGVDISELIGPRPIGFPGAVGGRRSFTPAGRGQLVESQNYGHRYLAPDLLNKRFVPVIADLRAGSLAEFGELDRRAGEEFSYVLSGVVKFHSELYAPITMREGDSIYFDSSMGHAYLAAAPGPCRILSVSAGPETRKMTGIEIHRSGGTVEAPAPLAANGPARRSQTRRKKN